MRRQRCLDQSQESIEPTQVECSSIILANSLLSGVWQRGEEHWSADHERDCEPCSKGGDVSDGGGSEVRRGEIGRGGGMVVVASSGSVEAASSGGGGGGDAAVAS